MFDGQETDVEIKEPISTEFYQTGAEEHILPHNSRKKKLLFIEKEP